MSPKEVSLKVGELTDKTEYGKGIVRIDTKSMSDIGIREGEAILLKGQKKTVVIEQWQFWGRH